MALKTEFNRGKVKCMRTVFKIILFIIDMQKGSSVEAHMPYNGCLI